MRYSVLIVDNHPISRAGLQLILHESEHFEIIGEATSGNEAVSICDELQPQIVIMDISMPNGNGLDATQILSRKYPKMAIVIISGFTHHEIEQASLRAGARGYISKETDFVEMIDLILDMVEDTTPLSGLNLRQDFNLTKMEYKVLYLLAEGQSRQSIADNLTISINTVKMHLRNLYRKLGVDNAPDAIKIALQHALLS